MGEIELNPIWPKDLSWSTTFAGEAADLHCSVCGTLAAPPEWLRFNPPYELLCKCEKGAILVLASGLEDK